MEGDPSTELVKAGIDALSEPVREFAGTIVGSPAGKAGELLADHIRLRRFRYQAKALEKAQAIVRERGLDPHKIPWPTLFPLLEGAANADGPDLADRWAALLATAAVDPDAVPPSYPAILSQLTAAEARVLDALYNASVADGPPGGWRERVLNVETDLGTDEGRITGHRLELAMDNLALLNLIGSVAGQINASQIDNKAAVRLTALGYEFVRACKPARVND